MTSVTGYLVAATSDMDPWLAVISLAGLIVILTTRLVVRLLWLEWFARKSPAIRRDVLALISAERRGRRRIPKP